MPEHKSSTEPLLMVRIQDPEVEISNEDLPMTVVNGKVSCVVCEKVYSSAKNITVVSKIKPRFLRLLQHKYPTVDFISSSWVCKEHVSAVLQTRVEDILTEDQNQFSKLQEDAMKNLERYELEEKTWQDQFERDFSFGERCADNVAHFGGSWGFIFFLLGFLGLWMGLNLILGAYGPEGSAWDSYPFILLNLFLSMTAAAQAPSIQV